MARLRKWSFFNLSNETQPSQQAARQTPDVYELGSFLTPGLLKVFLAAQADPARGAGLEKFDVLNLAAGFKPVFEVLP